MSPRPTSPRRPAARWAFLAARSAVLATLPWLAACGGSGPAPAVQGSIAGLQGNGLVLVNNGTGTLPIANGATSFSFSPVPEGANYAVSVASQPVSPPQICEVANPSGTLGNGSAAPSVQCSTINEVALIVPSRTHGIQAFLISPLTGALAAANGGPLTLAPEFTPAALALSPDGRFLYVADAFNSQAPGSVAVFAIDAGSLALTARPSATVASGVRPRAITIDPTGRFVYVAAAEGIFAYTIEPVSGSIAPLPGNPRASGVEPFSFAIVPSGRFAYANSASTQTIWSFALDANTGVPTPLPSSLFAAGSQPGALVVHPSGRTLYWRDGASNAKMAVGAASIDASSGALTMLSGSPFSAPFADPSGGQATSVAVDPLGRFLWGFGWLAFSAFAIDANSGALSAFDVVQRPPSPGFVAVDTQGRFLFASRACCIYGSGLSVSNIDAAKGTLSSTSNGPVDAALMVVGRLH